FIFCPKIKVLTSFCPIKAILFDLYVALGLPRLSYRLKMWFCVKTAMSAVSTSFLGIMKQFLHKNVFVCII
uniref:Uncharacterized protein n=1 Tax=Ciona intestinalis TaxID=7719 RepID=H2XZD9_CIOIN